MLYVRTAEQQRKKSIWTSEALFTTKLHESCRIGLIKSVHERNEI
jgi:hypothetical protein